MIDPLPSITKVFALVGQEERQWVISHVILPFSYSSVIGNLNSNFVNTSVSATKGKRDRPLCTHYNIPGHTVDKCYKLNGYLPGYKFKPKGKPTKIHINQASSSVGDGIVTPSSEISLDTLTANQCKQLLTFLSSQLQLNSSSTLDLQRMYNLLDHLCLVLVVNSLSFTISSFSFQASSWVLDTGATHHVCCSLNSFKSNIPAYNSSDTLPDG